MRIEMVSENAKAVVARAQDASGIASTGKRQMAKLVDGAQQFEAMMLEQMLKPLHFGDSPDAGDEESGGANDTIRGFGTEAIGKAIARGGGFGLARQIIRQVGAEHDAREQSSAGAKVL